MEPREAAAVAAATASQLETQRSVVRGAGPSVLTALASNPQLHPSLAEAVAAAIAAAQCHTALPRAASPVLQRALLAEPAVPIEELCRCSWVDDDTIAGRLGGADPDKIGQTLHTVIVRAQPSQDAVPTPGVFAALPGKLRDAVARVAAANPNASYWGWLGTTLWCVVEHARAIGCTWGGVLPTTDSTATLALAVKSLANRMDTTSKVALLDAITHPACDAAVATEVLNHTVVSPSLHGRQGAYIDVVSRIAAAHPDDLAEVLHRTASEAGYPFEGLDERDAANAELCRARPHLAAAVLEAVGAQPDSPHTFGAAVAVNPQL